MTLVTPAFAADEPTISGTVFRDFNSNGQFDAAKADGSASAADGLIDVGLGGTDGSRTKVDAYAEDGKHIGSQVEVNADGTYTLPLTGVANGSPVRVVFSGYPSDFYDSFQGSSSGSSVQFVTAGASSVNLGLHRLEDYSKGLTSPFITAIQSSGASDGEYGNNPSLTSIPGNLPAGSAVPDANTNDEQYVLARFNQTGAVWGVAYQPDDSVAKGGGYVYASAVLKGGSGLGSLGLGGIYRIPVTGDGQLLPGDTTDTDRSWLDVTQVGIDVGTVDDARSTEPDPQAFDQGGRAGIGGIAVSGSSLFITNLNDHKVYEINTTSSKVVRTYAPATWDGTTQEQPWALAVNAGKLYVGLVNTLGTDHTVGDTTTGPTGRVAYTAIPSDDSAEAGDWNNAPGLDSISLGYDRGLAATGGNARAQTQWHKWVTSWAAEGTALKAASDVGQYNFKTWAQPIISGISFDESGNAVLGLQDRWSLQLSGKNSPWPDGTGLTNNGTVGPSTLPAGDILYAGYNGSAWTLENNGKVTARTSSLGSETRTAAIDDKGTQGPANQGPGGQEFFEDQAGSTGGLSLHQETALGAVQTLPGLQQVATTAYDPVTAYETGGNKWLSLSDGQSLHGYDQYSSNASGYFGKAGGLGGLAILTSPSPLQIGNRVWLDADNDGVQDAGEPALGGVTVTLKDKEGKTLATKTTDAQGNYLFSSDDKDYALQSNTEYTLVFSTPADATKSAVIASLEGTDYAGTTWGQLKLTTQTATGDTTDAAQQTLVDSNPDPSTGAFTYTTPALGANDHSLDAGYGLTPAVSVGDFVWRDTDGDGVQDDGEPGIQGVVLNLVGPDGNPVTDVYGNVVGSVTTDANGKYLFPALPVLPAGQHYTVTIDQEASQAALADLVPTKQNGTGGDTSTDSSTWNAESTDLTTNLAKDLTLDFGFVTKPVPAPSVSVGDYVWKDADGDGVQDAGESGIDGVVLTIKDPKGNSVTDVNGKSVGPATTKDGGKYSFTDLPVLPAGQHYTVTIDQDASKDALTGLEPTKENGAGGDTGKDSSTWTAESTDLTTDKAQDLTLDFGFVQQPTPSVSVGDLVWKDTNGDGVQGSEEPGIDGVVLKITDPKGNPVTDVNGKPVGSVTTDANGKYSFTDLPVLPAGQHYTVAIDKDASKDALTGLEPTQSNVGDPAKDSSKWSATSTDLTTDKAQDLTLDFGFVNTPPQPAPSVSVGDYVWVDGDADGLQGGEADKALSGVTLTITRSDYALVTAADGTPLTTDQLSTKTDATGKYEFTGLEVLPEGTHYVVTVTTPEGYKATTAGVGSDASKDSSTGSATSTDLTTDGASDPTLDFGFVKLPTPSVSVGDLVWKDTNGDGVQDAGEPGIDGVVLKITDPEGNPVTDVNGKPVGSVTTDANGEYSFKALPVLPAGQHYTVTIDQDASKDALKGLEPTKPGAGSDRGKDSSTGSATSTDLTTDGASDTSLDFGFITPTYAVGDVVWVDADGNGQQGDAERLAGVTVTLLDADGNPVAGVEPVTTDEQGRYLFDKLPAGDYRVKFTLTDEQAAKYQFTGKSVEGSTAEDDSNADPATGISDVFTLGASNGNLTLDYTDQAFTATNGIDPTIDAGVTLKPVTPTPEEPGQPAQTETEPVNQGGSTPSSLARTGFEAGAAVLGIALLAAGLLMRRMARRRNS
ncbi:SdrD B-like domain-containing protein [Pseudoclavibacter sp. CFCC 11306]|uniref:SdrD B-like domain-containing protein n=1 Tax=Pseudoclavibacter sp. CFCC 11306 TaxID=1564493 RepID=UPI0017888E1D|nr:SdrD B-like domain-containing protein [Pseudoclavibacter sp. CFCC 11306]